MRSPVISRRSSRSLTRSFGMSSHLYFVTEASMAMTTPRGKCNRLEAWGLGLAPSLKPESHYDGIGMRFSELVQTSAEVARTGGRLEKIRHLADLLSRLDEREIETTVAFLSGATRQGRIGIGYAAIASASDVTPADTPTLEISDVDAAFDALVAVSGKGSSAQRARILRSLFARSTAVEQDFLRRLLHGELRQGALEGGLLEAIARAARVEAPRLPRAAV